MQRCEHCRVQIKGNKQLCPLCGGMLKGTGALEEETYPHIPTIYQEFNIFIRIIILLSIAVVAISIAINVLFTRSSRWSLFVVAGILCMWLSLTIIIRKSSNIPKTIVWQVGLIGILAVLWDASMGWLGWSIDYVIPSICVVAMVVMAIAAKILKMGVRDYIVYLLVDGVFGFIPAVFILMGWAQVIFPSVICVVVSVIFLSALMLFEGENIKTELKKRMHI